MRLFLGCLLLCLSVSCDAQQNQAVAYAKNTSTITAGYGIGNIWKSFLDKAIEIPEYRVKSTGPFTLIYEYAVSRRFSAGVQGSYSRVNGKASRFQLADQITILSLLARVNYHFWTSAKFDPYFGGGIGLNNSKYENKDPNTTGVNLNSKVPSTFDYSGQLGVKYFPWRHFGFYAEAGYVGGSFVQAGITAKF